MVLCAEVEETAFIDQRAVAAGKNQVLIIKCWLDTQILTLDTQVQSLDTQVQTFDGNKVFGRRPRVPCAASSVQNFH